MTNTKEAQRAEVEKLVEEYNALITSDGAQMKAIGEKQNAITNGVNEYTKLAKEEAFAICKASADPMLEAVKMLTFETIAAKVQKDKDAPVGQLPALKVVETTHKIDLAELDKKCEGIGADKNWKYQVEQLNCQLTAQRAKDVGVPPARLKTINDSFAMNKIAKELSLGETPCSNTKMLGTLQGIITAMLGDGYKVTSHDVNFLNSIYSSKGKSALKIACANHQKFRSYLAEVCHHLVTGEGYDVENKEMKAK